MGAAADARALRGVVNAARLSLTVWAVVIFVALAIWLARASAKQARKPVGPRFPERYDLDNSQHVALIDRIRGRYSHLMGYDNSPYAGCMYKPASLLPYPKPEIEKAIRSLLSYANGSSGSRLLNPSIRNQDVVDQLEVALATLTMFLDLPPQDLPTEPRQNGVVGAAHWSASEAGG